MTIVEQGGGPAPQAAADLIKETTTQTFMIFKPDGTLVASVAQEGSVRERR